MKRAILGAQPFLQNSVRLLSYRKAATRILLGAFCFFFVFSLLPKVKAQEGRRGKTTAYVELDRIMAVVEGQPITRSRLRFYRAYLRVLGSSGLGWPLKLPEAARMSEQEILRIAIVDELLFLNGSRIKALRVNQKDLEARMSAFRESFDNDGAYQAFIETFHLKGDKMREFFSRRLKIEGYITSRLGRFRVRETDIRAYWSAHRDRYAGATYAYVHDYVVEDMRAERISNRFDEWVNQLISVAEIYIPSNAPPLPTRWHLPRAE